MWIDLPDAVKIFAKFCVARYGTSAHIMVRNKAEQLMLAGDLQGHHIWSQVAQAIEQPTA